MLNFGASKPRVKGGPGPPGPPGSAPATGNALAFKFKGFINVQLNVFPARSRTSYAQQECLIVTDLNKNGFRGMDLNPLPTGRGVHKSKLLKLFRNTFWFCNF